MSEAFDRAELMERVDEDLEFLAETLALFREDYPALLTEIRNAAQQGDLGSFVSASHTLNGMVGNFCAGAAQEAALRLEQMGRSGKLDGIDESIQLLEDEVHRLDNDLEALLSSD